MSDLGDISVNSPFPDIEYGGTYGSNTHHKEKINAQGGIVQAMAADFLADLDQLNSKPANILCQYPMTQPHVHEDKKETHNLLSVVNHNCRRDKASLFAAATIAVKHAQSIADFQIDESASTVEEMADYLPKLKIYKSRRRRNEKLHLQLNLNYYLQLWKMSSRRSSCKYKK